MILVTVVSIQVTTLMIGMMSEFRDEQIPSKPKTPLSPAVISK